MPDITVNGTKLHYEIKGEGEPILFLHGMGGTWRLWEPQWDYFSKDYQMIMLDLRGHGDSEKEFPEGQFSYEVMTEDVKQFLNALQLPKVHVIGVSMGAVVGQVFAYSYPEYVDKLVLSDGFCEMPNETSKWVLALTIFLAKLLPIGFINAATYSIHKGNDEDEVYTREILKKSTSFTKESFIQMKKAKLPLMKPRLSRITAPTLVAYGEKKLYGIDEYKAARTIFENIPDATLVGFQGAFDPVTVMRKNQFNEVTGHFLKEEKLPDLQGVDYRYK